ncbi:MAG: outer membrane protein assembly factor BamB [Pseudomonadota bacterium]|nr:outer membrane protein assembly factor BamB [Pseudomonadota bacterium]
MTRVRATLIGLGALLLGGCQSLPSWMTSLPSIPPPSLSWLGIGRSAAKPGPLPAFEAKVTPRVDWQVPLGAKGGESFAPAIRLDAIFAAGPDGTIVSVDPASGRQLWRIKADRPLSAGVGALPSGVVVGTNKGEVLAFDATGKTLWQVRISTEVAGPPKGTEGKVIVWALDGRVYGLSDADGSQKWVYQRTNPPLTVRRFAGGTFSRGAIFTGTAGGKLLALDANTGVLGWEASVATPKGATELERIADVTSAPIVEERQACAAAYQGRVACFDIVRGTLIWSRDFSSLGGIAVDATRLYITDDKGAVHGLDKSTGASIWKQDKLAQRFPSGPVVVGDYVGVVDGEGYLHLLDRNDGNLVGRVATDGSAALSQPMSAGNAAVWQSAGGTLISASAR